MKLKGKFYKTVVRAALCMVQRPGQQREDKKRDYIEVNVMRMQI